MRRLTVGILAHVDAGKTTTIEQLLWTTSMIRKAGRVDHRDSFLDFDEQERERGITIYDKEVVLETGDAEIYVIDTPGHVDFSSEMERSLSVLDAAVVVISGLDGVQAHTETILQCLRYYGIPTIFFVNKMDIAHRSRHDLLKEIQSRFPQAYDPEDPDALEQIALGDEALLEHYLETNELTSVQIDEAFRSRSCMPVYFGSALKGEGIDVLVSRLVSLAVEAKVDAPFGAKVYRISYDSRKTKYTHIKITGGVLKAKEYVGEDQVDQIFRVQGSRMELIPEAEAGMLVALKGPVHLGVRDGLGTESRQEHTLLASHMEYELVVEKGTDVRFFQETCRRLDQEDPGLLLEVDEETGQVHVHLSGEVQKEILLNRFKRAGLNVSMTTGKILFEESILEPVIGSGHFEPLRHYGEVQVRIVPLRRGSGIEVVSRLSTDDLSATWQSTILNALRQIRHKGVLSGSVLTDVRLELVAGRAHLKHTSPGDLRQAARRAVRQGLMQAESILLEPMMKFTIDVPSASLSNVLFDLESRECSVQITDQDGDVSVLNGRGPLRTMMNYQGALTAMSKGKGRIQFSADGYGEVKDATAILEDLQYDPLKDIRNTPNSVFCAHGSGFEVPWDQVGAHMEIFGEKKESSYEGHRLSNIAQSEIERVLAMEGGRNRKPEKHRKAEGEERPHKPRSIVQLPECLIVDGYNVLYADPDLSQLAKVDLSAARDRLLEQLAAYQSYTNTKVIVVFDGYNAVDNPGSMMRKGAMEVVYTRTETTADAWIEKAGYELKDQYHLVVATSDALIQNAVFSQGALRLSARQLLQQIETVRLLCAHVVA